MTFFNGTAVAFFAVFDDAIAAGAEVFQLDFSKKRRKEELSNGIQVAGCGNDHLIGSIEEADPVSDAQRIDIVGQTAFGKLVGLDVIRSDDRLRHDTAVPVGAVTFITCSQTTPFHMATLSLDFLFCRIIQLSLATVTRALTKFPAQLFTPEFFNSADLDFCSIPRQWSV